MTTTDPADDLATAWVDEMLRVVQLVRATKPRDPLRAVEDALLDLRGKAAG